LLQNNKKGIIEKIFSHLSKEKSVSQVGVSLSFDTVTQFVFIGVLEGYEVGVRILLDILVLVNVTVLVDVLDMVDVDVGITLSINRFLSLFIRFNDNKKIKNFIIAYC
jgi:hypothetical protein